MNVTTDEVAGLLAVLTAQGPARVLERIRARADPADMTAAMADQAERLALSDLNAALACTEPLVLLADLLDIPAARARARRARGQALAYANRFDDALAAFEQAVTIAGAAGEHSEAARAGIGMLHALARLGRLKEAIEVGRRAHESLVSLGETALAARAAVNLGVIYRMLDEPGLALKHFDTALRVLSDSPVVAAQIQSNRGEALLDLCDFEQAERAFAAALAAFEGAGTARAASIAEGNLADLLSRQGRLGRALHHFERARARLEREAGAGDAARLAIEQAEAQFALGLIGDSAACYDAAIPVLEAHAMTLDAARARAGLARVLGVLGRFREAETHAREAAQAFRAAGQQVPTARTTLILAQLRLMQADDDACTALVRAALPLLTERPADLAAAYALLARAAQAHDQWADVATHTATALQYVTLAGLIGLSPTCRHLHGLALRALDRGEAAADELEAAALEVDRLRGALPLDHFRAAFASRHAAILSDAISVLLARDAPQRAFDLVQRAKSGSLLDRLVSVDGPGAIPSHEGGDAAMRLKAARARLRALVARVQEGAAAHTRSRLDLVSQIHAAEREAEAAEARLASEGPYRVLAGRPATLAEAQARIPAGWAFVEYFATGDDLLAMLIAQGELRTYRLGSLGAAAKAVDRLTFQITKSLTRTAAGAGPGAAAGLNEPLAELYRLLLGPLDPALRALRGVIIGPFGPLHAVPFHALRDDSGHLSERLEMLQCPSASVMARLAERPSARTRGVSPLVVGVPDEQAPKIAAEARSIAAVLPGALTLLTDQATLSNVLTQAQGRSLIHFACHAAFTPEAPNASGLRLVDGWLTARDAAALRLDHATITLSGCDAGHVSIAAGDELNGLLRAFLAAGAGTILATLWPTHDDDATDFMVRVYELWYAKSRRGGSLAGAVQSVRKERIAAGLHPCFWAPFYVVGSP